MEIYPIDVRMAFYAARQAVGNAHLPSDWVIATKMAQEDAQNAASKTRKVMQDTYASSNWGMATEMARENAVEKRQLLSDLINLRRANHAGNLRVAAHAHQDVIYTDWPLEHMDNGMVRASTLYYAIGQNEKNSEINIYWSRAQKYLKSAPDEDGVHRFVDDEYRYHCATLPKTATKLEIRMAIQEHHRQFRYFGINKMSTHGGDVSNTHSSMLPSDQWKSENDAENRYRYKTYAYTNDDFAVSVQENPVEAGDGWTLALHSPFERFHALKGFVETDGIPAYKKYWKAFFSNGFPIKRYASKAEALANMYVMIDHRTQMSWQGRNPIKLTQNIMTNALTLGWNFGAKEFKSKENFDEAQFDTGMTILTSIGARALFTLSFSGALVVGVFGGFAMRKLLGLYLAGKQEAKWFIRKAHALIPERADYILPTRDNMRRAYNTKPNEESNKFVRVLQGTEIDITHDPVKKISHREKNWKERWLCAYDGKAFSRQTSLIDPNTSTEFSFNGLVRLAHRDPNTGAFVTYVKYVEALDINAHISIPKEIKKLLDDGNIIRVEQKQNRRTISMEEIAFEDMEYEVLPYLLTGLENVPDYAKTAAKDHVRWLFNNASCSKTNEANDNVMTGEAEEKPGRIRKTRKEKGLLRIFGNTDPDIPEASKELVEFFRGCVLPFPSAAMRPVAPTFL